MNQVEQQVSTISAGYQDNYDCIRVCITSSCCVRPCHHVMLPGTRGGEWPNYFFLLLVCLFLCTNFYRYSLYQILLYFVQLFNHKWAIIITAFCYECVIIAVYDPNSIQSQVTYYSFTRLLYWKQTKNAKLCYTTCI